MRATWLPAIWLTTLAVGLSGCGEVTAPDAGVPHDGGGAAVAAAAEPATEPGEERAQHATAAPHAGPANRLAGETSPYLLMHAHNPVDWYPWGAEALGRAKAEQKLIFLSIGYSSCYWCHVMERESFMDAQIAAFLNKHFVCIKVDREERPDIDEIYMSALQAMSGRGGWPLSMFLTPDTLPIVGGTYFPPRGREGQPGFLDVLRNVQTAWQGQRPKVLEQGRQLAAIVRQNLKQRPAVAGQLDAQVLADVRAALDESFDASYGGFGYAPQNPRRPKFPEPSNLVFLLDRARRDPDDARAREMLRVTLEKMARGGIYDHLGGGFHRYSTDRFWRVPHFEKMLYDNGQLLSVYAEAYALTGQEEFRRAASGIARFVLEEMTGPEGAFYTALDAETDAHEGKFYIWKGEELRAELPGADFTRLSGAYGGGGEANFEGQHVLQLDRPLAELAREAGVSEAQFDEQLAPLRARLLAKRNERKRPLMDTKILTGWNGLMIGGLADAGRILEEPRYIGAAEKGARSVLSRLRTADGRLQRTWGGGKARLNGYLDDYAFLTGGLLALHRATGNAEWLEAADEVTAKQIELFADDENGGFFFTSHDHEQLLARSKDPVDGALPAGNSVAAENLLILAEQLERPAYRERAERTLRAALPLLNRAPAAAPRMATALARFLATGGPDVAAPAAAEPAAAEPAAAEPAPAK